MPVPIASHDQKTFAATHSNHFDLMNALVLLTMPLASYDTKSGSSGITRQRSYVAPHFNCLYLVNVKVPLMTSLVSHDHDA